MIFVLVFLGVALLTRVALLVKASSELSWGLALPASFLRGFVYDLGAAAFASLPFAVLSAALPERLFRTPAFRRVASLSAFFVLFALLFGAAAEWTFWDEFGVRFNFIAVDYLVYTTEVVGNIRESYDLPLVLTGIFAGAVVLHVLVGRTGWPALWLEAAPEPGRRRLGTAIAWVLAVSVLGGLLSSSSLPVPSNVYVAELGKNGLWSLFAAFRSNELDYARFYPSLTSKEAFAALRPGLEEDGSTLVDPGASDTLRVVRNGAPGGEAHPNVVQITVESLSAEHVHFLSDRYDLTPNLDALSKRSLSFDHFYATGTRTDRGMEALSLSLPPTPGRSLVKRPHNEDLFTLGSVFRAKGYDTAFLYGGYGYFDNMSYFFSHNGYRVIDRTVVRAEDVTFANVWGACDEDLYRWTLREADADHAAGKPFHFFLMTTSNHRPYTFPPGKIDLPSKTSGRAGTVKYTDFAIGQFLRDAATRPWFRNTIFVIVADHCAASAGRTEIPIENYHIPLLVYAPGGQIEPGHVSALTSQMDYAPTLLGLLHFSYASRFFGHDVRRVPASAGRAALGTYQDLGFLRGNDLVILKPPRVASQYLYSEKTHGLAEQPMNAALRREAMGTYQAASELYTEGRYRSISPEEMAKLLQ